MIKLIAMDMDGTLLSADHQTVSPGNKEVLKEAHLKGIKLAIATGRTLSTIGNICDQVPEIDYIMFSNGAGVYDRKKDLIFYHNTMSAGLCNKYMHFVLNRCRLAELYIDGHAYALRYNGKEISADDLPPVFRPMLGKEIGIADNYEFGNGIEKAIFFFNNTDDYLISRESLTGSDEIFATSSIVNTIEFTKAGVDKGSAIRAICDYIEISSDEVMALGDAENDIPMLKAAGYGIAMDNADEITKRHSRFITGKNTEDGVAAAIIKYALKNNK